MIDETYVKQLEEENEKLRKKLEENGLKSGCYDLIIDHLATMYTPSKNVLNHTRIDEKYVEIVAPIRRTKNNIFIQKIVNDCIEEAKAEAGYRKK